MRLILIRHGETAHNADGLVQGRLDVPLNDLGRRQAAALAGDLGGMGLTAVVSSPLARARETAGILAAGCGLPVDVEPDLAEMDLGEMEGLSGPEMRERHPGFMAAWVGPLGPATPMPGGESLEQVQARAWEVVTRLKETYLDGTVAAVSHNFVIATLVCRAINLPLDRFRRFRHGVSGRTVIDLRPDRTIIQSLNDSCHLDGDGLRSVGPWERR